MRVCVRACMRAAHGDLHRLIELYDIYTSPLCVLARACVRVRACLRVCACLRAPDLGAHGDLHRLLQLRLRPLVQARAASKSIQN